MTIDERLADLLIAAGIVQKEAVEDPGYYDSCKTLDGINKAALAIRAAIPSPAWSGLLAKIKS